MTSDSVNGVPFRTATFFGRAVLSLVIPGASVMASILAFTIVHCGLWTLIATLLLLVIHIANRTPPVIIGATVAFILLQLAITALTTALSQGPLGVLAWRSVYIGNALGWVATIGYILRWHPEVRTEFAHAED